jgi:hypothetical protein
MSNIKYKIKLLKKNLFLSEEVNIQTLSDKSDLKEYQKN